MIRQAISCDICGAEKKQTNHWFVAYTHAGELRVSGWGAQGKIRAGSKHLCGQTCLHKLVDEFIAGGATNRTQAPALERGADGGRGYEPDVQCRVYETGVFADGTPGCCHARRIDRHRTNANHPGASPCGRRADGGGCSELFVAPLASGGLGARTGTGAPFRPDGSPQELLTYSRTVSQDCRVGGRKFESVVR